MARCSALGDRMGASMLARPPVSPTLAVRKSTRKRTQSWRAAVDDDPLVQHPRECDPKPRQQRVKLEMTPHRISRCRKKQLPTAVTARNLAPTAGAARNLAAMTKIAEKQRELIDQLMSKLESGSSLCPLPTREMELHERHQLFKKLCALEPEHLATACSFAQLTDEKGSEAEYTLQLATQDTRTLWRLWDYACKNALTPAQKRSLAKRKLQEHEALLASAASTVVSIDSSDDDLSDSSDDDLSDSD